MKMPWEDDKNYHNQATSNKFGYSQELIDGAKKIDMSKVANDIWKMMQHENRGDFMYECPITTYNSEIYDKQMVERENAITTKISETIGIDVNREELIKALNYDRHQYEKGYADAKAEFTPKWTRVEDGLPETHEDKHYCPKVSDNVVCKVKDGDDIIDMVCFLKEFYDGEKKWNTVYEVIAWMPIPKYEGVEE